MKYQIVSDMKIENSVLDTVREAIFITDSKYFMQSNTDIEMEYCSDQYPLRLSKYKILNQDEQRDFCITKVNSMQCFSEKNILYLTNLNFGNTIGKIASTAILDKNKNADIFLNFIVISFPSIGYFYDNLVIDEKDQQHFHAALRQVIIHELLHRHPLYKSWDWNNFGHCQNNNSSCCMNVTHTVSKIEYIKNEKKLSNQELCLECDTTIQSVNSDIDSLKRQIISDCYSKNIKVKKSKKSDAVFLAYANRLIGR